MQRVDIKMDAQKDIIALQARIRAEAEQQQVALGDLVRWMGKIKQKDELVKDGRWRPAAAAAPGPASSAAKSLPSAPPSTKPAVATAGATAASPANAAGKVASAASHTYDVGYKKWQSFDADAALAESEGAGSAKAASPKSVASDAASASALPAVRPRGAVVRVKAGDSGLADAEAEAAKAAGNEAFRAGDYAGAAAAYTRAIVALAVSAGGAGGAGSGAASRLVGAAATLACVLYSNRSVAHLHLRAHRAALDDATAALRHDPTHVKSWLRRGAARSALGQPEAASRDLSVAQALDRGNRDVAVELRKAREAARAAAKRAAAEGAVRLPVLPLLSSGSAASDSAGISGSGSAATAVIDVDEAVMDEAAALLFVSRLAPIGDSHGSSTAAGAGGADSGSSSLKVDDADEQPALQQAALRPDAAEICINLRPVAVPAAAAPKASNEPSSRSVKLTAAAATSLSASAATTLPAAAVSELVEASAAEKKRPAAATQPGAVAAELVVGSAAPTSAAAASPVPAAGTPSPVTASLSSMPLLPALLRAPARSASDFERAWRSLGQPLASGLPRGVGKATAGAAPPPSSPGAAPSAADTASIAAAQRAYFLLFTMLSPPGQSPPPFRADGTVVDDALQLTSVLAAARGGAAGAGAAFSADTSSGVIGPGRIAAALAGKPSPVCQWPRTLFQSCAEPDTLVAIFEAMRTVLLPSAAAAAAGAGAAGEAAGAEIAALLRRLPYLAAAVDRCSRHDLAVEVALRCIVVCRGLAATPRLAVAAAMLSSADIALIRDVIAAAVAVLPAELAAAVASSMLPLTSAPGAAAAGSSGGDGAALVAALSAAFSP